MLGSGGSSARVGAFTLPGGGGGGRRPEAIYTWARSVEGEGAPNILQMPSYSVERRCSVQQHLRNGSQASGLGEGRSRRHSAARRSSLCHSRSSTTLDIRCLVWFIYLCWPPPTQHFRSVDWGHLQNVCVCPPQPNVDCPGPRPTKWGQAANEGRIYSSGRDVDGRGLRQGRL